MGENYNYGLVICMLLFAAALLLHMYINHGRDTARFRILKWGLHLLVLNQLADILRAETAYGHAEWGTAAVYIIYTVYYLTEATILLLTVMYMLTLFPELTARHRMLQTVFFAGEAVVTVAVISAPLTGLFYRMDSGVIVLGSGGEGFFIGRLVILIAFLAAVFARRRVLPPKLFQNWMAVLAVSAAVHVVPVMFRNVNGFGMFANIFFCMVYCLFHSGSYEEGTARMRQDMYYREIDYRLAKKREFHVFEIRIENYESLVGRGSRSEEEMGRLYGMVVSKLAGENRQALVFQKKYDCLGVTAAGLTPERAKELAGRMSQWMGSFWDGSLDFRIAGITCPECAAGVSEAERLLFFLQEKCALNSFHLCSQSDYGEFREREDVLLFLHNLRMEKQDVVLFARPVIDGKSFHIERFEILCRAQMAGCGIIHADRIVSLAERYGYTHDVNMAALKHVCDYLTAGAGSREDLRVSLHISSTELESPDFARDVLEVLENYEIAPETLGFEVRLAPDGCDIEKMSAAMHLLRGKQVIFILTDVTPEAVNFECIAGLPFKTVKFDQQCVQKAADSAASFEVTGMLVDMIRERGCDVVFKGIENEELEETALSLGADYLQGAKYANPLPVEEMAGYLDLGAMY